MYRRKIDRRTFIKIAGAASTILLSGLSSHATAHSAEPPRLEKGAIEKSIKANFGPGFQILTVNQEIDRTIATIEHLENRYIVSSSNLFDWQILHSNTS